jgi:hypothetical protein
MTQRRLDKYIHTRHIELMDLPFDMEQSSNPYVADMQRRRYTLEYIEQQIEESNAWRPAYCRPLDMEENYVLQLYMRLSYFESGCYHGVALSVRDVAAYLGYWDWGHHDRAVQVLRRLIEKRALIVLEEQCGRRPRVCMPNPQLLEDPPYPLRSYREPEPLDPPEAAPMERKGQQVKEPVVGEERVPPPPAQKGQGGASAPRAACPADLFQAALDRISKNSAIYAPQRWVAES